MAYSKYELFRLYYGALEKKHKYEKLKKIEESLTTIKAVISSAQLSFEMSNSNLATAISAVPSAIIDDSFNTRYLPKMEESKSTIVQVAVDNNEQYIKDIEAAKIKVEDDIIKVHDKYIELVNDLNYYRATYTEEIKNDGLFDSTCINR